MVKILVSKIILFLNILHSSTVEAFNRTAKAFRNNIKQSNNRCGGWGISQLADALRHKTGVSGSNSRGAPWKF
jgi:hypothetical protein